MQKLILILLLTATFLPVFSQEFDKDSVTLLKIENLQKSKYVLVEEGEYVSYRLKDQPSKKARRGKLRSIQDNDTLIINQNKIAINDLAMFMSKTHKSAIKTKYIGLGVIGGLAMGAGIALLSENDTPPKVIGIVGIVAGFSALISSIIPLSHSNHYTIEKGWTFKRIKIWVADEEFIYQHY